MIAITLDPAAKRNRPRQINRLSALLNRYRRQEADIEATVDQEDVDRLVNASQETLRTAVETRVANAGDLADKIDALIRRYDDFGALPMAHVRQLLLDAHHLAVEPGFAQTWVHQWYDLGGRLHLDTATGESRYWWPDPLVITDWYTSELPPHLRLTDEQEARGAAKALLAMIHLAGKRAGNAIFAFADEVKGA